MWCTTEGVILKLIMGLSLALYLLPIASSCTAKILTTLHALFFKTTLRKIETWLWTVFITMTLRGYGMIYRTVAHPRSLRGQKCVGSSVFFTRDECHIQSMLLCRLHRKRVLDLLSTATGCYGNIKVACINYFNNFCSVPMLSLPRTFFVNMSTQDSIC